jgi:glycosyltransferase involved in cell wall biosynthesis
VLNILWIGVVFDETTVQNCPAVSPAANKWQAGLIKSIQELGHNVFMLGHLPEPLWPKGRGVIRESSARLREGFEGEIVPYLNIPLFRTCTLKKTYMKAVLARVVNTKIDCLISYNILPATAYFCLRAQAEIGIPWVALIADAPGFEPEKSRHDNIELLAKGRILLSWVRYNEKKSLISLHLPGGLRGLAKEQPRFPKHDEKHILLYAGTMSKWGGVNQLIEAIKYIKNKNFKLWICGKGTNNNVLDVAQQDNRIKMLGFVSEEHLHSLMVKATIFVNPRPDLPDNRNNFPSKLFDYFKYCKPVVSTWTDGLDPVYRNILSVAESNDPTGIALKIDELLGWSYEMYSSHCAYMRNFVEENCLWAVQAKRCCDFLQQKVVGT